MPGRGRGHRRRRGRRHARLLEPTLLLLLHRGAAHGYTLLDQLSEFGLHDLNPGPVYRTLRAMEAQGWVTSVWEAEETLGPPRRVYSLTAEGEQTLAQWVQELGRTRDLIDDLVRAYAERCRPDVAGRQD